MLIIDGQITVETNSTDILTLDLKKNNIFELVLVGMDGLVVRICVCTTY
jgi:hypothetical protein